ncbi:hypothetical protein GCM10017673_38030 [Streptosporangium violaceochromogenes]|nr:hypothetical protein GCM10017673_38030 [Streptosporangium violaceochromogenes]
MAVTLASTMLGKRPAVLTRDGHGTRSATQWGPLQAVSPGHILSEPAADGEKNGPGTATLAVDPALWPLDARDLVVEPGTGRQWTVVTADLRKHSAAPVLNWVKVEARPYEAR